MKAKIWTIPNCPYCTKAKKLLDFKKIEYECLDGPVDNWPTSPYLEIDGQVIGGFTELARFLRNL